VALNDTADMHQPILAEVRSHVESVQADEALFEPGAFARRADAIERLEVHVLDRIGALAESPALEGMARDAERLKHALERVDEELFSRLRAEIRDERCRGAALLTVLDGADSSRAPDGEEDDGGYRTLDAFVAGLLLHDEPPDPTRGLEPGMVAFQPTPARIVLDLVRASGMGPGDVFCDVGSGLGHVPMLVNLLAGARAVGVEFEPAYCEYARAAAAGLNLPDVRFVQADARTADFRGIDIFFLYTPFRGAILREVLGALHRESRHRPIRVFTYGPCTREVVAAPWLERTLGSGDDPHRLAGFRSR
jgi:hypothetical protein